MVIKCICTEHGTSAFRPVREQYIDFLADTLEGPAYAALLPPLPDLVQGFGVDPEVAFKVCIFPARHVQMPPDHASACCWERKTWSPSCYKCLTVACFALLTCTEAATESGL